MSTRSCGGSMRVGAGGHEVVLDALYERKRDKKSVRVLTVLIYVFSVSLAAIMLSLYYVFFWEPKDTHQRKVSDTVERQGTTPLPTCLMPHTGGSSAAVDDKIVPNPASLIANKTQKTQPYVTTQSSQEISESSNSTFDYDLTTDPVDSTVENKTLSYNAVQNNVT